MGELEIAVEMFSRLYDIAIDGDSSAINELETRYGMDFDEAFAILNRRPELHVKELTKEEARKSLIDCGVMNEYGQINPMYKDVIIKNEDTK